MTSVPASVYDAVGVSSPTNPGAAAPQPAGTGSAPLWLATADGGPPKPVVFFYGAEFAPYAAVAALAADPRPVALRHLQPARADAVEPDDRVRQPVDLHLLERLVLEQVPDPRVRRALQRAEPDRGRATSASQKPDARQAAAIASYGSSARHLRAARRGQPLRAQRRQLRPGRAGRAHTEPDRREPRPRRPAR